MLFRLLVSLLAAGLVLSSCCVVDNLPLLGRKARRRGRLLLVFRTGG